MKKAEIVKIEPNKIEAMITADSMCAHCQVANSCVIKECSKKKIEIVINKANNYKVGDIIEVDVNAKSSFFALLFAYIIPLVVLLLVFYGLQLVGVAEINCGVIAIISLIPYYFLLFLLKDKIKNKVEIQIHDNH